MGWNRRTRAAGPYFRIGYLWLKFSSPRVTTRCASKHSVRVARWSASRIWAPCRSRRAAARYSAAGSGPKGPELHTAPGCQKPDHENWRERDHEDPDDPVDQLCSRVIFLRIVFRVVFQIQVSHSLSELTIPGR